MWLIGTLLVGLYSHQIHQISQLVNCWFASIDQVIPWVYQTQLNLSQSSCQIALSENNTDIDLDTSYYLKVSTNYVV